ncbi:MAG: DUF983 domain-containing protein [Cytophagaceae bacterium]|nr:DUF983 domain-containing protein [Gemmatimonadaceae bacterium]
MDPESRRLAEANNELNLKVPTFRRILSLLGRSFTLRCPFCGGRPVFANWFRMRERCGNCNELLERGEHDYFLGAMLFNLVLGEFLFVAIFVVILLRQWPDVPWDAIQLWVPLGMIMMPVVTYPVSKLLWLSFDLALRPGGTGGRDSGPAGG